MNRCTDWRNPSPRRQRGATLLVGLIMLVLLTLHALSSFHTSTTQLRTVGNTQERQSALAASQQTIEQVLSTPEFVTSPASVAARRYDVDVDGDGVADFSVAMQPVCKAAIPVLNKDLDPDAPEDIDCVAGTSFGGTPLCTIMQWDLQATATVANGSAATGTTIEIHQGAAARSDTAAALRQC